MVISLSFDINGTTCKEVFYNNTKVNKIIYDNKVVFPSIDASKQKLYLNKEGMIAPANCSKIVKIIGYINDNPVPHVMDNLNIQVQGGDWLAYKSEFHNWDEEDFSSTDLYINAKSRYNIWYYSAYLDGSEPEEGGYEADYIEIFFE